MIRSLFFLSLAFLQLCFALYGPISDVVQVQVQDNDVKTEVLKDPGIVTVEFCAPWWGLCKQLAPEWEQAAITLKGVAKIVAVDATVHQQLAQKYQIQGFPTIKMFGTDKNSPTNYQQERSANAIVSKVKRQVNGLIKDRTGGRKKDKSSKSEKVEKGGRKSNSNVIELIDVNFHAVVNAVPGAPTLKLTAGVLPVSPTSPVFVFLACHDTTCSSPVFWYELVLANENDREEFLGCNSNPIGYGTSNSLEAMETFAPDICCSEMIYGNAVFNDYCYYTGGQRSFANYYEYDSDYCSGTPDFTCSVDLPSCSCSSSFYTDDFEFNLVAPVYSGFRQVTSEPGSPTTKPTFSPTAVDVSNWISTTKVPLGNFATPSLDTYSQLAIISTTAFARNILISCVSYVLALASALLVGFGLFSYISHRRNRKLSKIVVVLLWSLMMQEFVNCFRNSPIRPPFPVINFNLRMALVHERTFSITTAEKNVNGAIGKILSVDGLLPSIQFRYGWGHKRDIFCRRAYISIYQIMKDIVKSSVSQPVMLITGVPGIGKSVFSVYFMIQILIDDDFPIKSFFVEYDKGCYQRITFVSKNESLATCYQIKVAVEEGVYPDPERDLILSDIRDEVEPKGIGRWTCIFSSPNTKRYKQTMNVENNYKLRMPTWSEEELQLVNPKKQEWHERFLKFGGVPRHVLWNGNGENPEIKLKSALQAKGGKVIEYFFKHGFGNVDSETSYMLLHMNPPWIPEKNEHDYQQEEEYDFASDEVFKLLAKKYETSLLAERINLFNAGVAPEVYGGGSAGNLFEKIVLWLKPIALQNITLVSLDDNRTEITVALPEKECLDRDWKELGNLQVGVLYQPKISNLESGDCFCVVEVNNEFLLIVLQMTVGQKHPIKANGLQTIVMAYPDRIRSLVKQKILGFVIPVDGKLDGVQALHTQDGRVIQNAPKDVQDFKQYVCRYKI